MEIALGIVLFFGAFALGALTSESVDHATQPAPLGSDDRGHHQQVGVATPLENCPRSDSVVRYRDLTVPYARAGVQTPTQARDGEGEGSDE